MKLSQPQHLMMISRTFSITLVRHGETMANRERIMQGQMDTELSEVGHEQARLVGVKLRDVVFTHMYSSNLRRAADTARAIATANTVSPCTLVFDKRLQERRFGCLEGKPLSEFFKIVEETGIPAAVYTPTGGETVPQVSERATDFLSSMCMDVLQQSDTSGEDHSDSLSSLEDHSDSSSSREDHSDTSLTPGALPEISTSSEDLELPAGHVLIVAHGLLLRELRLAIMRHYYDDIDPKMADDLKKISPNTGVSRLVMRASRKGKKLAMKVMSVDILDDNSHLKDNMTTHFKGAL